MISVTREQVVSWKPCCRELGERYDDAHLDALFAGRASLTPADTAALNIPREDVVWLWAQAGALPHNVRQRWIERVVYRAVETHALRCGVPSVEEWALRWLSGEDRSEASAARATAWAARAAAWAARAAAWAGEANERERQVVDLLAAVEE